MYKETAQDIIKKVTSQTSNYAQVRILAAQAGTTRFAKSEISQNVSVADISVTLTVFDGKKEATASTNILTDAGLAQLAKDADALLAHVPPGEYEAFPFPKATNESEAKPNQLAKQFGVAERAALVKEGMGCLEAEYTASGALVLARQAIALGDTNGAFRYAAYDDVSFNTVVTHTSGVDGAGACASYTDAPDVTAQFKKAQATAKAARNPVPAPLGAQTVVLSPSAFGDLVMFMSRMVSAKSVDDGMSFAAGKVGQKVFGANVTILDDAAHPDLRPVNFDFEGNTRTPITLIENGVIKNLLYDNKRAAKHNTAPTGHAAMVFGGMMGAIPTNIIVTPGGQSMDEIIADTENGIFINEFHYTNFVNPRNLQITGLVRNGTFLIEKGKLTAPITTVRFTESLLDAFNNITAISKEQEKISGMGLALMPGVRIEDFHFTSKA